MTLVHVEKLIDGHLSLLGFVEIPKHVSVDGI
jgi:hypothetical protein